MAKGVVCKVKYEAQALGRRVAADGGVSRISARTGGNAAGRNRGAMSSRRAPSGNLNERRREHEEDKEKGSVRE